MKSGIVETTGGLRELEGEWKRLQEQDPDVTYYSTFEYLESWWESYKEDGDKEPFVVCIRHNGRIVAIAPFIIENHDNKVVSWNVLKFMGEGDYRNVLLERGEADELNMIGEIFACVQEHCDRWDRIQLSHIRHDSVLAYYMLRSRKYNPFFKYLTEYPYVMMDKYEGFEEYRKKRISKSIIRHRKRFERECGLRFSIMDMKSENIEKVYKEVSSIHIRSQLYLSAEKGRNERRSLFEDERIYNHVRGLCTKSRNSRIYTIRTGEGTIAAYIIAYAYKGILHGWNTAYNPEFEKYSPGNIIGYESIRSSFESDDIRVYDMGAGRYYWKFAITDDFVTGYHIDMWNEETQRGQKLKKFHRIKNTISL